MPVGVGQSVAMSLDGRVDSTLKRVREGHGSHVFQAPCDANHRTQALLYLFYFRPWMFDDDEN